MAKSYAQSSLTFQLNGPSKLKETNFLNKTLSEAKMSANEILLLDKDCSSVLSGSGALVSAGEMYMSYLTVYSWYR